MDIDTIRKALKEALVTGKISQNKLAESAGVSAATLSLFLKEEHGNHTLKTLGKVEAVLIRFGVLKEEVLAVHEPKIAYHEGALVFHEPPVPPPNMPILEAYNKLPPAKQKTAKAVIRDLSEDEIPEAK